MPENALSEDRRGGKISVERASLAPPDFPWMRAEGAAAPSAPSVGVPAGDCHFFFHNSALYSFVLNETIGMFR